MHRPNHNPNAAAAATTVAGLAGTPYTDASDGKVREMTGAGRERSPETLTRAEKILVTMLVAVLGSAAAGFFAMNATMNANFTAVNGHLLGLQKQIGDLRTEMHEEIGGLRTEMREEIGGLRTEVRQDIDGLRTEVREDIGKLDTRIARLETLFETHLVGAARSGSAQGKPEPPSGS